ncbi:MAG: CoA-binding protein [Desulfobacteraceae bacterium]|nr:CoA-binding protein [Desulfobacteraceae bacterium]
MSYIKIDYGNINGLFSEAEKEKRDFLYEYETYQLLKHSGAETPPKTLVLKKQDRLSDKELMVMPGGKAVLKIVSPTIVHKTEVGGVKIVEKTPSKIRSAFRRMLSEVPENYTQLIERNPSSAAVKYKNLSGEQLRKTIAEDIRGVLMVQYMPPDSEAFGNELIVGIRNTREFGMIISAGLGGTDTELYAQRFRKEQAIVIASTVMTDGESFFEMFRKTISYKKLAGLTRGQRRIVTDEQLIECFSSFICMANYFSPSNPDSAYVIEELEINPFAFTDYLMVPLDGLCRFSKQGPILLPRPYQKIAKLLQPETIGIIGVSTARENFGRIILNNIRAMGFEKNSLRIIKPGMDRYEGIRCVPDLSGLDVKLSLLVVAVASDKVPGLVDEILETDATDSVMLISGGMGETRESEQRAHQVMSKIEQAHAAKSAGPVFLGANCLGVISHPGKYDTLFIPEAKLPKQRGAHKRNAAFISQSGAFMITRLSKRPELDPAYLVSLGNQNDLTLGDFLRYLKDDSSIDVIGVYAEGFKDQDGLSFIKALKEAVIAGKDVIFYKAGRSPEGKTATLSHTASIAGDYVVCESCVRHAGGIVARTFTQFEDLLMLSQRLHSKKINANRLAALSGAGFEAVGMADNIQSDDYVLQLARFSDETKQRINSILEEKGLSHLVEVKNPLDINPGADDQTHVLAVNFLSQDPNIDAVVVGLDPLSPVMKTLAQGQARCLNFGEPGSIARELPKLVKRLDKPVAGVVDAGKLYDPLVDELMGKGMAIFRSSDRAVRALAMYIEGRLQRNKLRNLHL